jgi:hypothetical protein
LTERHAITFRKQLINLLYQPAWVILMKLSEINMTPLINQNKTQSFITRLLHVTVNFLSYDIESAIKNAFIGFAY